MGLVLRHVTNCVWAGVYLVAGLLNLNQRLGLYISTLGNTDLCSLYASHTKDTYSIIGEFERM